MRLKGLKCSNVFNLILNIVLETKITTTLSQNRKE